MFQFVERGGIEFMNPKQSQVLQAFLKDLEGVEWFSRAGEPSDTAVVASDAVVCWDDWNREMLAVWLPKTKALEQAARKEVGDSAIDEIFSAVSIAIDLSVRQGLEAYFNRRPANSGNTKTNADRGLWPEILDTVKRDISWAAIETIIDQRGFFTELLAVYRAGRWPCAWSGEYPDGQLVVL